MIFKKNFDNFLYKWLSKKNRHLEGIVMVVFKSESGKWEDGYYTIGKYSHHYELHKLQKYYKVGTCSNSSDFFDTYTQHKKIIPLLEKMKIKKIIPYVNA